MKTSTCHFTMAEWTHHFWMALHFLDGHVRTQEHTTSGWMLQHASSGWPNQYTTSGWPHSYTTSVCTYKNTPLFWMKTSTPLLLDDHIYTPPLDGRKNTLFLDGHINTPTWTGWPYQHTASVSTCNYAWSLLTIHHFWKATSNTTSNIEEWKLSSLLKTELHIHSDWDHICCKTYIATLGEEINCYSVIVLGVAKVLESCSLSYIWVYFFSFCNNWAHKCCQIDWVIEGVSGKGLCHFIPSNSTHVY